MQKQFPMTDRYPQPSGHVADQRSKALGGRKSPLDPMAAGQPGYSAEQSQAPGNSITGEDDYGDHSRNPTHKKLPGQP